MKGEHKTYLVTGGAGFIGSNFVKYLLSAYSPGEVSIVIIDALTYAGNLMTIAKEIERPEVTFFHGNINDTSLVRKIFEDYNPDYVINFAAESHVDRSITDPRIFLETNVLGTQCLLEAARETWKGCASDSGKRFLQVSTDEVYGTLSRDYSESRPIEVSDTLAAVTGLRSDVVTYGEKLFTEETPLAPRSPYSASKAAADMLVTAYGETYGLPVIITRCSNNYGPYQFPEKLIPLLINNLRNGLELPVYGKGENVRDWLYVEDHVIAIDTVLRKGRPGRIYNIGGLNEKENIAIVREIVDLYAMMTGTKERSDLIKFVTDRPGHDARYAIDPSKTAEELGWAPRTPFGEGIKKTVRWNIENREWIDSVTSGEYRTYYSKMYDNR